MKASHIITEQLEITFTSSPKTAVRCSRRMGRAKWWFGRMHQVVNQALDWSPAPSPRPEQIYLALAESR